MSMITYVTYREATFTSMAALGAAREQTEEAGWFICTIRRQGKGATALFGFEALVESTDGYIRPELPEFRRPEVAPRASWSLFAGLRSRVSFQLHRRRTRTPLVPRIRPSVPHGH